MKTVSKVEFENKIQEYIQKREDTHIHYPGLSTTNTEVSILMYARVALELDLFTREDYAYWKEKAKDEIVVQIIEGSHRGLIGKVYHLDHETFRTKKISKIRVDCNDGNRHVIASKNLKVKI